MVFLLILYIEMKESSFIKPKAAKPKAGPNPLISGDRAFVYQQAQSLNHPVAVIMQKSAKGRFRVIFLLDPLGQKIQAAGEGGSFILASLKACKKAREKISLSRVCNYEAKEAFVEFLKSKPFIH